MKRSAFTAVEALMTLGVVAVTAGLAVPMWRSAQIRNDLKMASAQVKLALELAQSDARKGVSSSGWGVYVDPSVGGAALFKGLSYDGAVDQKFPFPATVTVEGLTEVAFLPVSGEPTSQGEMIFTSLTGDQIILTITPQGSMLASEIVTADGGGTGGVGGVGTTGSTSTTGSTGTTGSTSTTGSTGTTGSTSTTGTTGSTSTTGSTGTTGSTSTTGTTGTTGSTSTTGDTGSTSTTSGGGARCRSGDAPVECDDPICTSGPCEDPAACEDRFVVSGDDTVFTTGKVNVEVKVIGADITYGAGGPEVSVMLDFSKDKGSTYTKLFGGADVDGNETETFYNVPAGSKLIMKFVAKYQSFYQKTRYSNEQTGFVKVLRTGDPVPNIPAFANQTNVATYLQPYVSNGRIEIGQYDAIFLVELGTDSKTSSSFDLNDAVVLMRFTPTADSCSTGTTGTTGSTGGSSTGPRFKVSFDRLVNSGIGNAAKKVFMGPDKKTYDENVWIPLTSSNGAIIQDGSLVEEVAGLAGERRTNVVRILSHGTLPGGSKEIVDAVVTFDGACVLAVENDEDSNRTEAPFDGVVNDTADGDEVTIRSDKSGVTFQTRVTTEDDAILIQWKEGSDCATAGENQITICHVTSGKGTADISFQTLTVNQNAWGGHEGHGDTRGSCASNKEIQICHFTGNPSSPYKTLAIFESQWPAYREVGDRLGKCTDDDDDDGIDNWEDVCPNTERKERPSKYLLWFRNAHQTENTEIFNRGPTNATSQYTLDDTSGCDCKDILDIAERKPGAVMYKTPALYFSLGTLPQFYIETARKFGCTDSLVENVRRNTPVR